MKVLSVNEDEDGSALVEIDMSKEEVEALIQEGLLSLLNKTIAKEEEIKRIAALFRPKEMDNEL